MKPVHSIQMAAKLTGLSQNLIRTWELRYQAVEPSRTETQRRLYSEADIHRLQLLKELTGAGHSIGQIATLPDRRLRELAGKGGGKPIATSERSSKSNAGPLVAEALAAIEALDEARLEIALKNGAAILGTHGALQLMISPLVEQVGERWRDGHITAAHEHFGTGIIRDFLKEITVPYGGSERSPIIVVATPVGQLHEMGALIAAAVASNLGWQALRLGASLPAAEIAGAARQRGARAVGLSVVYPEDDPTVAREIQRLRELLPEEVAIIAGGRGVKGYEEVLGKTGAFLVEDLSNFGKVLDSLRKRSPR